MKPLRLAVGAACFGSVTSSTPFSYFALDFEGSTGLSSQMLRLA
jgi:hypothetical protein